MINIQNLHAKIDNKEILKGLTLSIKAGETHAIMGPNGAGKSTLSYVIAGKPGYEVTSGTINFNGQNVLELAPDERAHAGIFLAFQYPVALPGVNVATFLRTALNAKRDESNQLDAVTFLKLARTKMAELKMNPDFLKRNVNDGFSGGEKKRFEMLQMILLEPSFTILDETDSGLDIDALKIVAEGANAMKNSKRSFLVITHYERLLRYIKPDYIHILANGKIVKSGGAELAKKLEKEGYESLMETAA